MIRIALGSPRHACRHALSAVLGRHPDIRVVATTAHPATLPALADSHDASLVVVDTCGLRASPHLVATLAAGRARPKVLLCADSLATPDVLTAVQQGVHGCVCCDAEAAVWHRAVLALDAGETWMPRWIMAEALALLMQRLPEHRPVTPPGLEPLTDRQREIVHWVAHGLSNKEIARRLDISPMTVKTHLHNIFDRVGVSGRHQLAVETLRRA